MKTAGRVEIGVCAASFVLAVALVLNGWLLGASLVCAIPILVLMFGLATGRALFGPIVVLVIAALVFAAISQVLVTAQDRTPDTTGGAGWGFVLFSAAFTTATLVAGLMLYVTSRSILKQTLAGRVAAKLVLAGFVIVCSSVQWSNVLYLVDGIGRTWPLIVAMTTGVICLVIASGLIRLLRPSRVPVSIEILLAAFALAHIGSLFALLDIDFGAGATVALLCFVAGHHLVFVALILPSAAAVSSSTARLSMLSPAGAALTATPLLNLAVAWLVLDGYRSRNAVTVGSIVLAVGFGIALWLLARERSRRTVVAIVDDSDWRILRKALDNDELSLYHQPILRLADRRVVGTEALVRWQRGSALLSGAKVIEFARGAGAIEELEQWVMQRAVLDARKVLSWLDVDKPYVSFNVSPEEFVRPGLTRHLVNLCDESGCSPDGFMVELTETSTISDWAAARLAVTDLQNAGFKVAVDDFGAGHANLLQLQHLDVDRVKLDRDIVVAATTTTRGRSIAASAASMVRDLGVLSIAEGVEDLGLLDDVEALGCEYAQGYAIACPMPLNDLEAYLLDWESTRRGVE